MQTKHSPKEIATAIYNERKSLKVSNTSIVRKMRKRYTAAIQSAAPEFVFALAISLIRLDNSYGGLNLRWVAYELVQFHPGAFANLDRARLEMLGEGIDSWWTVDAFGRSLSGPAWLEGLIDDGCIHDWACSEDPWWRRAALVSTVALNMRSHGGMGDCPRTLAVCRKLAADKHDMVVKAMSWALRCLVVHDPEAVRAFLIEHGALLAGRIKREVRNKLETGLKNPKT